MCFSKMYAFNCSYEYIDILSQRDNKVRTITPPKTCTHTHTCLYPYTHTRAHIHTCTDEYAHTHTCAHAKI